MGKYQADAWIDAFARPDLVADHDRGSAGQRLPHGQGERLVLAGREHRRRLVVEADQRRWIELAPVRGDVWIEVRQEVPVVRPSRRPSDDEDLDLAFKVGQSMG